MLATSTFFVTATSLISDGSRLARAADAAMFASTQLRLSKIDGKTYHLGQN